MTHLFSIAAGFLLDLIFGDPRFLPHPVVLIGKLIARAEKAARSICGEDPARLKVGGALIWIFVVLVSFAVPYFILEAAGRVSPYLRIAVETFMMYQIFCAKSLKDESMKVCRALEAHDLSLARKMLSYIVGRDTAELSEEEIAKAAVETVAENTSDGIVAPMLYMFLGGAPLAFLYKGVNTMDSMLGYRDPKFLHIGFVPAKMDDLFNLVPARLSAVFMIISAFLLGLDGKGAVRIFLRDRYNHLSPNSAMTESVAAGAMGLQLGGDHYYFGKMVHKKTIGDAINKAEGRHILIMDRLMYVTCVVSLLVMGAVKILCLARAA